MRKAFRYMLRVVFMFLILAIAALVVYEVYKKYLIEDASIESAGSLSINYKNGSMVYVDGSKDITFNIYNSSNETVYYYITYKNAENIHKDTISFVLKDGEGLNVVGTLDPYSPIFATELEIKGNASKTYTLSFKSNVKFALELDVELEEGTSQTFGDTIINNNTINKETKTKVGSEVATLDEGLIENADDNGVTYYFRGNVKNNYAKVGNYLFRIVRVNGDGSVKLILDGTLPEQKTYYPSIGDYSYGGSNVVNYLNNWVNTDLKNYSEIISNSKFCNDNTADNGKLMASDRIVKNNIPSLYCLGDVVSVKAGLLTVDEAIFAGATTYLDNTSFYLYNNSITTSTYTMTGYSFDGTNYYPFYLNTMGKVTYDEAGSGLHYIRPVININKTAKVTGSGTYKDPYVLTK